MDFESDVTWHKLCTLIGGEWSHMTDWQVGVVKVRLTGFGNQVEWLQICRWLNLAEANV